MLALRFLGPFLLFAALSWGQCSKLVFNPLTSALDCIGNTGGGTGNGVVSTTFTTQTSVTLTHNAGISGSGNVPWSCVQATTNAPLIPVTVTFTTNTVVFTFSPADSGTCTAGTGGTGVTTGSGTIGTIPVYTSSSQIGDSLISQSGSVVNANGLTISNVANVKLITIPGGSSQATNALLDVTNSAGSSHWLTVLGDGKVGVGTNTPGVPFETTKDLAATSITAAASIVRLNGYAALNRYAGIGYHYSTSTASQIPPVWTGVKASLFTGETGADYIIATRSNAAGNAAPIERVYVNAAGSIGLGTSNVTPTGISVLDATPSSGATATWVGHDGSGTYSGVHLSALTTSLKVVAGLTQGATNLQEWQGPSGTVLTRIMSTGMLNASDGTQGLQVGAYTGGSGYGAIYLTGTTPGASNYIMVANTTETVFNNPSQITFGVNSQSKMAINTGGLVAVGPVVAFTSSFPALKRSTTGLISRLADDSADTWFQASQFRSTLTTPASAAAACTTGTIVADTGFVYVCTATDTWKRVAIATW